MRLRGIWNELLMDNQAILAPRGPLTAFKSCFYSSSLLFFPGTFFFRPQKQLWCISSQALYGFDEAAGGTPKVELQTWPLWCIRVFRVCFQNDASSFSEDGVFIFFSGRRSDILSSKQVEEPRLVSFHRPPAVLLLNTRQMFLLLNCAVTHLPRCYGPNNLVTFLLFMVLNPVLRRSLLHFC